MADTKAASNSPSPKAPGTKTKISFSDWILATFQISLSEWLIVGSLIFGGCCSNVFALEVLVSEAPKSGSLITFLQFLFVSVEGFLGHIQFPSHQPGWPSFLPALAPRKIPLWRWFILVILFFSVSVINNAALAYHISVPLHIIFRSGGLIVNMFMGWLLMNKKYTTKQITAVLLVTVGVIFATLGSANPNSKDDNKADPSEYAIGIALLSIALVISACMGLYQEYTYKKFGKEWREGLFYSHFLSLPFFLMLRKDIIEQLKIVNASPPVSILDLIFQSRISAVTDLFPKNIQAILLELTIPRLWIYLGLNVLTQYVCISGVHRLTSFSTSLTLNLVLNLRKFVSLFISVVYFDNEFGLKSMFGTLLVFLGTFMYTASSKRPPNQERRTVDPQAMAK